MGLNQNPYLTYSIQRFGRDYRELPDDVSAAVFQPYLLRIERLGFNQHRIFGCLEMLAPYLPDIAVPIGRVLAGYRVAPRNIGRLYGMSCFGVNPCCRFFLYLDRAVLDNHSRVPLYPNFGRIAVLSSSHSV